MAMTYFLAGCACPDYAIMQLRILWQSEQIGPSENFVCSAVLTIILFDRIFDANIARFVMHYSAVNMVSSRHTNMYKEALLVQLSARDSLHI